MEIFAQSPNNKPIENCNAVSRRCGVFFGMRYKGRKMLKDVLWLACVFVAGFILGVCCLELYNDLLIDEIAEEVLQRSRNQERLRIVDRYCHDVLTRGR